jgi:hypothetical protein
MEPAHQIELLSVQDLDRLTRVAKRLFNEAQEPTIKMLYAAALRGLREEIKSRQAYVAVLQAIDDWEDHDPFEN